MPPYRSAVFPRDQPATPAASPTTALLSATSPASDPLERCSSVGDSAFKSALVSSTSAALRGCRPFGNRRTTVEALPIVRRWSLLGFMSCEHNTTDRRITETRSRIESLLRYYRTQHEECRAFV